MFLWLSAWQGCFFLFVVTPASGSTSKDGGGNLSFRPLRFSLLILSSLPPGGSLSASFFSPAGVGFGWDASCAFGFKGTSFEASFTSFFAASALPEDFEAAAVIFSFGTACLACTSSSSEVSESLSLAESLPSDEDGDLCGSSTTLGLLSANEGSDGRFGLSLSSLVSSLLLSSLLLSSLLLSGAAFFSCFLSPVLMPARAGMTGLGLPDPLRQLSSLSLSLLLSFCCAFLSASFVS